MGKHIKPKVRVRGERVYQLVDWTDPDTDETRKIKQFVGTLTHKSKSFGWIRTRNGTIGQFDLADMKASTIQGEITWNNRQPRIKRGKQETLFDLSTVDLGKKTKMGAWE